MKSKTIFYRKWPSTGRLDAHLAKSLYRTPSLTSKVYDFSTRFAADFVSNVFCSDITSLLNRYMRSLVCQSNLV